MRLSTSSIKRPATVIVLMIAIVVIGILGYTQLATNLLPDITYPMIKVYVTWRGATPEEIEDNIATVIERKIATVDNLDYMESQCTEGLYALQVYFTYDADRDIAYQDVLSKLGLVRKNLPKDAEEPLVFKADPSQLPVMDLLITSDKLDLTKLRTYVENELQDQFTSIEGTAGTEITGGLKREIRVHIDPLKLQGYGLSVDKIAQRLKDENLELLGGRVISDRRDYIVRTVGEFTNINEIENLIISKGKNEGLVLLKDVAEVKDGYAIQRIKNKLNSVEGVKLSVFKQTGANTVEVSDLVTEKLKELKTVIPPSISLNIIYDQAEYIRAAVAGVRDAALIAAFLVVIVTAFFLTGWKRVLIVSLTLPVTLLGTFFFMQILNFSINIFTLGGLVVAITVLLDNCIVVLENITRIQEEELAEQHPVQKGAAQVSGAVLTATLTFIALFLPFLLVSGLVSLLFKELIITVAITITLSLIVALTLTPTLTSLFFKEGKPVHVKKGIISKLADGLIKIIIKPYKPLLRWSLKYRWIVVLITLALFFVGLIFLNKIGSEFLPKADDGQITVKIKMPTGSPMEETHKVISQLENFVKEQPYIDKYSSLSGGKIWGLVTYEIANEGEINIQLVKPSQRPMTTDEYVEWLTPLVQQNIKFPGLKMKVFHTKLKGIKQTGEFDIEVEVIAPRSEPIENIYEHANRVSNILKQVDGLTGIDVSIDITKPEYQIFVDRTKAIDQGLSVNQIASTIKSSIDGAVPTQFKEEGYYYPIRIVVDENDIKSVSDVENLSIYPSNGSKIRLNTIAKVEQRSGPLEIDRKDQNRVIKATANVTGRTVGEATADIQKLLSGCNLPLGYKINFGGQSQMLRENFQTMVIILLIAMFFAYVVLVINFEDFIKPFIILIRVPLSLIGVSYALYLTNQPIGVTVMIGFIILAGIEINQGVILITFIDQLREQGMSLIEAIQKAAVVRLRPILMTDIVGIIGLLPLALSIGEGTELLKPMAIAVIGGLIFGLVLVFLFLPALYLIFERRKN
ncbi:efflux RND transporter permease subunit [Melioribacter sp. OK-6-Me]|uniref:efflux RND transporter permease subunit n=1 Tax=unclassified Melioribacter TaxID=2627329 RepID=UPI003ED8AE4D